MFKGLLAGKKPDDWEGRVEAHKARLKGDSMAARPVSDDELRAASAARRRAAAPGKGFGRRGG